MWRREVLRGTHVVYPCAVLLLHTVTVFSFPSRKHVKRPAELHCRGGPSTLWICLVVPASSRVQMSGEYCST
ncbi:hypothetical protein K402DRAFT_18796 [Aulographum hederae CBS 113979]|uniref:Uncharacterized protein n=1 Tax=Aulographum hederae CBS 113979 TaxID=1176131 RepID=A0A6G1H669_9PEZI|nr:hypothetical protein K402DRAFT_18796 [Aulographum hederae CBS 113979]